jgi:hypothetical protein
MDRSANFLLVVVGVIIYCLKLRSGTVHFRTSGIHSVLYTVLADWLSPDCSINARPGSHKIRTISPNCTNPMPMCHSVNPGSTNAAFFLCPNTITSIKMSHHIGILFIVAIVLILRDILEQVKHFGLTTTMAVRNWRSSRMRKKVLKLVVQYFSKVQKKFLG